MSYPGNPSLAADIQGRILSAYRSSVESAAAGNRDQALLGCDFILRLDDQFQPARDLQKMLAARQPAETYLQLLESTPGEPPAQAPAPAVAPLTASSPGLVATFSRLLEARRFEEILSAAQAQAAAVNGDPKLRDLVAQAQAQFEAEPFVRELLDKARRALGSGELDEIDRLLEQARSLDPTNPGLAEIDRLRSSASATAVSSLTIDWDDEAPAPTQVKPPEGVDVATKPGVTPPAAPVDEPEPEAIAKELGAASDLDLPEIDFSMGGLPEMEAGLQPGLDESAAAPPEDAAPPPATGDAEPRVQALLDEGQGAFEREEYQSAIDAWSRIFLIDIDNQEAARRIERARQLKAERERETEEVFHTGVARFDAGDWEAAREAFRKVLDEQPSYVLAREYLDKIDEREAAGENGKPGLPEMAPPPEHAAAGGLKSATDLSSSVQAGRAPSEEILVPPDPGTEREARRPAVDGFAVKARRGALPSGRFLAIGGGVLVILIVGGWILASRWDRLFPNSRPPSAAAEAPSNTIAQAKKLHDDGKTAVAIAILRRIPPQDSAYAEAQSLVSQWEKLSSGTAATEPAALPREQVAERKALLDRAETAVRGSENYLARKLFEQAAAIAPLDDPWSGLAATAEENLGAYSQELGLMKDGEYEMALNRLWRRHQADPGDRDAQALMVDAYYDLSISDLQRGDPQAARAKIKDALELNQDDPMLARLDKFCATYERRDQDLLYRIFVKYLPTR